MLLMESQQLSLFLDQSLTPSTITKPKNFRITEEVGARGTKTKALNNIKAIRLCKALDAEQRPPTVEEQAALAQYLGWGIAPEVFEEPLKPEWLEIGTLLRTVLTPAE